MSKKSFMKKGMALALTTLFTVGLAGCGLKSNSSGQSSTATKTLVVVNWKDYGSDKA